MIFSWNFDRYLKLYPQIKFYEHVSNLRNESLHKKLKEIVWKLLKIFGNFFSWLRSVTFEVISLERLGWSGSNLNSELHLQFSRSIQSIRDCVRKLSCTYTDDGRRRMPHTHKKYPKNVFFPCFMQFYDALDYFLKKIPQSSLLPVTLYFSPIFEYSEK